MREIKFRAWDKRNKHLIKTEDISHFDLTGNNRKLYWYGVEQVDDEEWRQTQEISLLDDFELMQFTGLKDKNEKEIYEGDIVKLKGFSDGLEKDIDEIHEVKDIRFEFDAFGIGNVTETMTLEVIGNIYENPELLKQ